jgi:DNA-binding Xre family transcriptional regulator
MKITYKKLWKLLIDKELRKLDLQHMAGISSTSIAKLSKGENVHTDVLVKICKALSCDTSDIMEIEHTDDSKEKARGESQ